MSGGRFITFEGPEGSGKTTQIALLADALRARGCSVVATREPGGTPLGDALRRLLLDGDTPVSAEAEAYLMTGARAQHVRDVISPALGAGQVVLCDRFVDSTLAYQGGGRGLPAARLRELQRLAVGDVCPALTLLLDLPVELGLARRERAGAGNRIDAESLAFHERVAGWYRTAAADDPLRWRVIDATQAPAVVHTHVLDAVSTIIGANVRAGTSESGGR